MSASKLAMLERHLLDCYGFERNAAWFARLPEELERLAQGRAWSLDEAIDRLLPPGTAIDELLALLTVKESYFFRHPEHFELLRHRLETLAPCRPLHLWSAGCARGEEPYSMAICVRRSWPLSCPHPIEIVATDCDLAAVNDARVARYPAWAMRGVEEGLRRLYFVAEHKPHLAARHADAWQLRSDLRQMVRFERAHLLDAARRRADNSLDVIFFRNVGIYLSAQTNEALFAQFRRILRPDGVLLLAPSDPRPSEQLFVSIEEQGVSAYRARAAFGQGVVRAGERVPNKHSSPPAAWLRSPSKQSASPQLALRSDLALPGMNTSQPGMVCSQSSFDDAAFDLLRSGDPKSALDAVQSRIALHPSEPHHHAVLGLLLLAQEEAQSAVDALRNAVALDEHMLCYRFWYALALKRTGARERASRQLRALLHTLDGMDHMQRVDGLGVRVGELRASLARGEDALCLGLRQRGGGKHGRA
ncbi:MAG: CheR family methyltransferase [Myxococcota bacterium]|nr:CheR family methyltransferase [Myxococcota bacterium]